MQGSKAVLILRMPQAMLDELDAHAYKLGISREAALRAAVAAYTGKSHPETHGNTKYHNDTERLTARRAANKLAAKAYREKQRSAKA